MDQKSLSYEQDPNEGSSIHGKRAVELLNEYFVDKVKSPNFYQLKAFIQFFGR